MTHLYALWDALRRWWGQPRPCKEGEGMLVYWCVTHHGPWRPDVEPTCREGRA